MSATITTVKWLVGLLSGLGLAVGFGFALATHHHSGAIGWTRYAALNQTQSADYLPKHSTSWLPALVVYPLIGVFGGLIVALVIARLGFRLTRGPR